MIDFSFDDSVFDYYKISKDDSIFDRSKLAIVNLNAEKLTTSKGLDVYDNTPKEILEQIKNNKHALFFKELSINTLKLDSHKNFLNMYENFKPFHKFFFKSINKILNSATNKVKLKRILVVDDSKIILKALKKKCRLALKDLNLDNEVEVISAYDGVDELSLFKIDNYLNSSISLIISDYNMNMMNGGDFLRLVDKYRHGRDIKLLMCSTDNDIYQTLKIPNLDFLSKEATKSELKMALKMFCKN